MNSKNRLILFGIYLKLSRKSSQMKKETSCKKTFECKEMM